MNVVEYGLENRHLNWPENTAWYNLGDWSGGETRYARACERLAHRLAQKAGFRPGQSLLDIGCGSAEQDLYWSRAFGLTHIDAITLPGPQLDRARARVAASEKADVVTVEGLSLEAYPSQRSYDHVAALDSAYHFDKKLLLDKAYSATARGGRLAFTDLIRTGRRPLGRYTARALGSAGIDSTHLCAREGLDEWAKHRGFALCFQEDLSTAVLRGFSDFIRRERWRILRRGRAEALRFVVTGVGLHHLLREGSLEYQLLVYERG